MVGGKTGGYVVSIGIGAEDAGGTTITLTVSQE